MVSANQGCLAAPSHFSFYSLGQEHCHFPSRPRRQMPANARPGLRSGLENMWAAALVLWLVRSSSSVAGIALQPSPLVQDQGLVWQEWNRPEAGGGAVERVPDPRRCGSPDHEAARGTWSTSRSGKRTLWSKGPVYFGGLEEGPGKLFSRVLKSARAVSRAPPSEIRIRNPTSISCIVPLYLVSNE